MDLKTRAPKLEPTLDRDRLITRLREHRLKSVLMAAAGLLIAGVVSLRSAPVDTYPEFTPPSVEIQTEALGLSAGEIEQLITVPLEADLLNGVAWLKTIRSESLPGLSSLTLVFEPGTDPLKARQVVQERITQAKALPNVSRPPIMLEPLSSSSRVMMIGLSPKTLSLIDTSVLARWTIKPRLMGVPGVANVSIWGQRDQQLQVQVDPKRPARKRDSYVPPNEPAAHCCDSGGAGAGAASAGQTCSALPHAQSDRIPRGHSGDVDIHPLGKKGVMLDFGTQPTEIDRVAVRDEEHGVRVADVDGSRLLEVIPADRERERIHRVSERDRVPFEAWLAHVDRRAAFAGLDREDAAWRLDLGRHAVQDRDRARGVAARFDLAAVGIEDPHPEVGGLGLGQHDQLVATDPGAPVGQRARQRGGDGRQGLGARVEHDEVVAEAMHLGEGGAHGRHVGPVSVPGNGGEDQPALRCGAVTASSSGSVSGCEPASSESLASRSQVVTASSG